jgi:hypothetical protein
MTTRTPKAPAGALCVVTINGYLSLAMPVDKGLALVRLLSGVLEVDRVWESGVPGREEYSAREQGTHAELVTISGDQIVKRVAPAKRAAAAGDLLPEGAK